MPGQFGCHYTLGTDPSFSINHLLTNIKNFERKCIILVHLYTFNLHICCHSCSHTYICDVKWSEPSLLRMTVDCEFYHKECRPAGCPTGFSLHFLDIYTTNGCICSNAQALWMAHTVEIGCNWSPFMTYWIILCNVCSLCRKSSQLMWN